MTTINKSARRFSVTANIVFILLSFICIVPFILLITSSFADNNTIYRYGYSFFPRKWSLAAYQFMMTQRFSILRAYGISVLITVTGTFMGLFMTTMFAYALSRQELKGRRWLTFYVFFTLLFNGGLVPTYLMYVNYFHIKNTLFALLIPYILVNGFNILLMRTYFINNIPIAVIESAKIDGSGEFRLFFQIVLPMSTPILATIGLLIGVGYWNDWYNGMLYITDPIYYSLQNMLNRLLLDIQFMAQNMTSSGDSATAMARMPTVTVRMAIAVIGAVPILVIFPFFQKYFSKGITLGAVKG